MNNLAMWPGADSDSDQEENEPKVSGRGNSESHLERGCSDLYEDDEDSEAAPRFNKRKYMVKKTFYQ